MKKVSILIALFIAATSFAQNDYASDTKHYLEINGTKTQYVGAIDGMFTMLKNQFKKYDVSNEVWDALEKDKSVYLENVLENLVPAYQGYFSASDIKNMIVLFESEAGKRLVRDRASLTGVHREQLANFYNSETGQKMIASQEGLTAVEGEVSQKWSGDLYKTMIAKLEEAGFALN